MGEGDGPTDAARLGASDPGVGGRLFSGKKLDQVMDNLNIHAPSSLYEAFEPEETRRILERLEIHCTPRHGSWLNIAEIEIGVLSRQCLSRCIPDREAVLRQVGAWHRRFSLSSSSSHHRH